MCSNTGRKARLPSPQTAVVNSTAKSTSSKGKNIPEKLLPSPHPTMNMFYILLPHLSDPERSPTPRGTLATPQECTVPLICTPLPDPHCCCSCTPALAGPTSHSPVRTSQCWKQFSPAAGTVGSAWLGQHTWCCLFPGASGACKAECVKAEIS